MKLQPTALILILSIASDSCQRPTEQRDAKSESNTTEVAKESGITAKRVMPDSMMQHIRDLDRDVSALESSTEKDHAALAAKIDAHTTRLISSCTLDGEAHDTLHDWLMPFLQLNKD